MDGDSENKFKPTDFGEPFSLEELEEIEKKSLKLPKLTDEQALEFAEKSKEWARCASCGAVCDNACLYLRILWSPKCQLFGTGVSKSIWDNNLGRNKKNGRLRH